MLDFVFVVFVNMHSNVIAVWWLAKPLPCICLNDSNFVNTEPIRLLMSKFIKTGLPDGELVHCAASWALRRLVFLCVDI